MRCDAALRDRDVTRADANRRPRSTARALRRRDDLVPVRRIALVVGLAHVLMLAATSAAALEWPGRVERLMEQMEDSNTEHRISALRSLSGVSGDSMTALLERAMRDPEPSVRRAALDAAATYGSHTHIPLIIEGLTDRNADVRQSAARALGHAGGPDATGPLVGALRDRDPAVRSEAIFALGALGSADASLAISGMLHDSSRDVVIAAITTLGHLAWPGSVYLILEKVHDPAEAVALAAIQAIADLRAVEAIPSLIEQTRNGRQAASGAAIDALGELGHRDAVSALVREVIHPSFPENRDRAIQALVRIGDPAALRVLDAALRQDPLALRELYTSLAPESWAPLRTAYTQTDISTPRGVELLIVWLASGDPQALDAFFRAETSGQRSWTHDERASLLSHSRTIDAFCHASLAWRGEVPPGQTAEIFAWASEAGAVECLREAFARWEDVPPDSLLTGATSLMESGDAWGVSLLLTHVDVRRLDWARVVPIIYAAARLPDEHHPTSTELFTALLTSSDPRIRREAAWVISDLPSEAISPSLQRFVQERAARYPEIIHALAPVADQPTIASWLLEQATHARVEVRLASIELLRGQCTRIAEIPHLSGIAVNDYWLRRALQSARHACDLSTETAALASRDPVLRALGVEHLSVEALEELVETSTRSDIERVAALRALQARDPEVTIRVASPLRFDRDRVVAASAWLALWQLDALDDAQSVVPRALASRHSVERAALYAIIGGSDDHEGRATLARREQDPRMRALLTGEAEPYASPLQVFTVDTESGQPRPDESVFVLYPNGDHEVLRTDTQGRLRILDAQPLYVAVVRAAEPTE